MLFARRSSPVRDTTGRYPCASTIAGTEAVGDVQPVDPFFEKGVPTCHRLVVPPVIGSLQAMHQGREMREHHLADRALRDEPPQGDCQRLVMIVLADEHGATGAVPGRAHGVVVGQLRERGLLHQHVLPRLQRVERQLEMKPRRHGDDDRIDAGIVDRLAVRRKAADPFVSAAVLGRFRPVAAGVAADGVRAEPLQVAAVDVRNEAAAQKGQSHGVRHGG